MADFLAGDVVARLRADVSQFNQAIADVLQRLQQLNQAGTQATTQQSQGQQSTNQLATAYVALAQSIAQQTQAYAQAQQATLAYRQSQDQARAAAQQLTQTQRQAADAVRQAAQQATQQAAQAHATQLQAAKLAAQAQLQVTQQLHARQLQEARLAAQAQLQAAREAAAAARQAVSSAGAGGGLLQQIVGVAGGIGVATSIQAIVGQLKDLAVSAVDVATRMQSLRASLSALGGGAAAGAQQFAQLFTIAQGLGVAFEPLARGFRTLTAAATQAGLPLADQQRLLVALATESRRVGASNEELGRAITALGQIASKGKVSMEELRQQLGEAIPTAMAAAAKGMGVTTEALNKMIETGTVDFVPFAKALTRGFEEMQAASGKFSEGAQSAFARLSNAFLAFKESLGANVLPELERLAKIATGILDTATALLNLAGGRRDPRLAPNTASEIVGTPDEEREIARLRAVIERLNQQAATAVPGPLREQRLEMAKRAQEELNTLIELVQAKKDEAAADAQGTAEINKQTSARERQVAFVQQLTKALDDADKKAAEFRQKATLAPEREGRLGGTFEEAQKYRKGLAEATGKEVDRVAEVIRTKAEDITVPADLQARFAAQRQGYAGIETAIKSADEAEKKWLQTQREREQASKRAAREREAEAKAAVTQAIQLDATLERLGGLTRRPDENKAEEAASRVRAQYAGAVAEAEKMIVALERSKALQAARPEALEQFKALRDALREAGEAQAKLASEEVLKQQMAPLAELAVKYGAVTAEIISQSEHVQELASTYGLSAQAVRDLAKAEELAAQFTGTARQEAAEQNRVAVETGVLYQAEIELLKERFTALKQNADAMRTAEDAQAAFTQRIKDNLEQLQAPREERAEARLRAQARRQHVALTPENEALLQQITAQERWNDIMGVTEQIGDRAAQSITDGLLSIIDGTKSVSEAFKLMAKNILDSIAQIVMHETFKRLIGLGIGLLGSAFAPTIAPEGGASAGGGGFELLFGGTASSGMRAQGGAIVNRPTTILAGENPAMNPEYVVNSPQMKALMGAAMRAAPSAGGQAAGGDVSVILVDNRGQAEREAAAQRGMGRQVIIQEVTRDLAQGAGSSIGRVLRAGGF